MAEMELVGNIAEILSMLTDAVHFRSNPLRKNAPEDIPIPVCKHPIR
jgi:hypothetical protein